MNTKQLSEEMALRFNIKDKKDKEALEWYLILAYRQGRLDMQNDRVNELKVVIGQ